MFASVGFFGWMGLVPVVGINLAAADQDALRALVGKRAGVAQLLQSKAEPALVAAGQERFAMDETCRIDEAGAISRNVPTEKTGGSVDPLAYEPSVPA